MLLLRYRRAKFTNACAYLLLLAPCVMAQVDIPAGTELSIRLASALSSKHSQAGQPVSAMLIAPVSVRGREVLPAGFVVRGTVANPRPAHERLNHAVLWLNFGELIGEANHSVPFRARVLDVDNGRESVDSEGVIHGLRPLRRRPGEIEDLLMLAAAAHPAVLASLEVGRFVVAEEEKPRITYGKGVEFWLTLTAPLRIRAMPEPGIRRRSLAVAHSKDLDRLVSNLPMRTSTPHGTPSDLVNVLLLGSQQAVVNAFVRAGWLAADSLDLK
ncbi:MAG TPA: LssY C-terminal domain-containing protein, partial [Bryobacteraceae bacterium]|nr:LssY C-terminal domain-containing protein [Bryobacteraceae bacterium]